jgi:leucyl-tRNA synthetase
MKMTGHAGVEEPFAGLFTQGMVVHETYRAADGTFAAPAEVKIEGVGDARTATLIATGGPIEIGPIEKMSKSKRNTVDSDDIIGTFGADTARWFMLSDSPPERDVIWTEEGVQGAWRFIGRIWRLIDSFVKLERSDSLLSGQSGNAQAFGIRKVAHRRLSRVEELIERLNFNVAVANIYEFYLVLSTLVDPTKLDNRESVIALREALEIFVQLFAPMMPHLAEECWEALGHASLVAEQPWPQVNPDFLVEDTITLPVQVNGKKRADVTIERGAQNADIEAAVLALDAVKRALDGKRPKKVIIVPQRIVNVVA